TEHQRTQPRPDREQCPEDTEADDEVVRTDPFHTGRNLLAVRFRLRNSGVMTIVRIPDFGFDVPEGSRTLHFEVCGFGVRVGDRRIEIDPWLAFDERRAEPDGADRWERLVDELT